MSFNAEDFIPKPAKWFKEITSYKGLGKLEFFDPPKILEGRAIVKVNSNGHVSVKMEANPEDYRIFLDAPDELFGAPLYSHAVRKCKAFRMDTKNGVFYINDITNVVWELDLLSQRGTLRFSPAWAEFITNNSQKAKFWVAPLTNCMAEVVQPHPDLINHPLRLYSAPQIPENLSSEEHNQAIEYSRSKGLISFEFNGELGFIDQVPSYAKRKEQLIQWKRRRLVTAVMIGEVGKNSIVYEKLNDWFPIDYLYLLSIATDIEVGMPWIEFRDSSGNLVKRLHVYRTPPNEYSKRPPAYTPIPEGEIGELLTKFAVSNLFHDTRFRGAIRQRARCGMFSRNFEEANGFICRGLDELCGLYKTKSYNSFEGLELEQRKRAEKIIQDAIDEIDKEKRKAQTTLVQQEILTRLASQVQNSRNVNDFGQAVARMIKHPHIQFPDVDIIEQYYSLHPRTDGRNWVKAVSYLRGGSAHSNFFNTQSSDFNSEENLPVILHLYDLLTRIILKSIDYNGNYRSILPSDYMERAVNWVTSTTTARELHYP